MKRLIALSATLALVVAIPTITPAAEIGLSELNLTKAVQGWETPKADKSVQGKPLTINKKTYAKGFGTHAVSELWLQLDGKATTFTAEVGIDDEQNGSGTVEFALVGDGKVLWHSEVMASGDAAKKVSVKLAGVKSLLLYVTDGGDGTGNDHADWVDATIAYDGAKPEAVTKPAGAKLPEIVSAVPNSTRTYMKKAPDGYTATLFAQPPQISYPVEVCAMPTGEVFVAIDKNGSLDKKPHFGSIVRAIDTDGDGIADKFDTFVADVDSPRGLSWDGRTLLCLHPPTITAYRDTDGDGKADWQEDIVTGVGYGLDVHPADHTSNGIRQAIDGWVYLAIGDFGVPNGKGKDGSTLTWRGGGILRVRSDGSELEMFARHTRNVLDVCQDPYLNGFIRDNTNDGDGWNSRLSYILNTAEMGYPSLYKRFGDELFAPLADYGGGSAVGSLFVHEPGLPGDDGNGLLTCDWGTSAIYRNPVKADGAGWAVEPQKEWAKIERVTDVDVDGQGRFYASSWKGAVFTYAGEKVGAIIRLAPTDAKPAKFPDLAKAADADLVKIHLVSPSAVCRQQTQNEILRRGVKPVFTSELTALSKSASAPLYVRVAAIFTLKQLLGAESHATLLALTKDAMVQEWALRALADRKSQLANVPLEPFLQGLASDNLRVRAQAIIGLNRLGKPEVAKALVPLTAVTPEQKDAARIIPHLAVQALIALNGWQPCIDQLTPGTSPEQLEGVLWALRWIHDEQSVKAIIAKLGGAPPELKKKLLTTLVRLHQKEGEWDKKHWWGTRPEHMGPYFQRASWAGTPAIEAALKETLAKGDEFADHVAKQIEFLKVKIDGAAVAGGAGAKKNDQADAELLAKAQAATKDAKGQVIANLGYEDVMAGALAAKGDPKLGKELFTRQACIACHTVAKDAPPKGPYLGEIAKQYQRAELIESIVKPNEKISQGFTTRWFDLKDGQHLTGFVTSEGAESIELRNIVGQVITIPVAQITKRGEDKNSMMPVGLVNNLKPEELASILAYFESLVGK